MFSESVAYFQDGDAVQTSSGQRLSLWTLGLQHFVQHPLQGVGVYRLQQANQAEAERGQSISAEVLAFGHAHNQYVEALATGGLIGFATFMRFTRS